MKPSRFIARFDSASGMVQAIAPYLHGQDFAGLGIIHLSAFWWPSINRLPAHLRQRLYQFGAWREGVLPEWLGQRACRSPLPLDTGNGVVGRHAAKAADGMGTEGFTCDRHCERASQLK